MTEQDGGRGRSGETNPERRVEQRVDGEPDARFALRSSFGQGEVERTPLVVLPWVIAGVVVMVLVGVALLLGHGKAVGPVGSREQDEYGAKLEFSGLQMSESTSLSGGKSTFIDGMVKNTGDEKITGATMLVLFGNDEALPAQKEQVPLTLIRTREPYVDTEPVSVAPLGPGQQAEFRLIFENIGSNWNQQMPAMRVTQTFVQCNSCR